MQNVQVYVACMCTHISIYTIYIIERGRGRYVYKYIERERQREKERERKPNESKNDKNAIQKEHGSIKTRMHE